MLDSILDIFTKEVQIEPWTGQNRAGEPTYGTATTYQAKIEHGNRQIQGQGDRAIVPKHKIFLGAAVLVDPRDRITLPVEYGERDADGNFAAPTPVIREVQPVYDELEHVCTIIYCG